MPDVITLMAIEKLQQLHKESSWSKKGKECGSYQPLCINALQDIYI
jgi:hypothetical protein